MNQKPNFELLKDAYAIIAGIPAKYLDLKTWRRRDQGASCGTIACAAGWLTLHPKFQALGLATGPASYAFHPHYPIFGGRSHTSAMAELFTISDEDADWLFSARGHHLDRDIDVKSDKGLFLARMRVFLRRHGQLKSQLAGATHAS